MLTNESITLGARLLSKVLDVVKPSHHGIIGLSAKDPWMATMHATGLASLEHEFVRRGLSTGVWAELLVLQKEWHHWRLRGDMIRWFEFVQMCGRKDVPNARQESSINRR